MAGRAGSGRSAKRGAGAIRPRGAPSWSWFLAGLALGLFAAMLVHLHHTAPGGLSLVASVVAWATGQRGSAGAEGAAREQAVGTPAERPRFEFYTILPEMEVAVPESEIAPPAPASAAAPIAAPGSTPASTPGTYVLQVGSFRRADEADRLKARLALIGLEADIQRVPVNGGDTWHRVRLGPFTDLEDLNATRARLRESGLEAIVLRIRT